MIRRPCRYSGSRAGQDEVSHTAAQQQLLLHARAGEGDVWCELTCRDGSRNPHRAASGLDSRAPYTAGPCPGPAPGLAPAPGACPPPRVPLPGPTPPSPGTFSPHRHTPRPSPWADPRFLLRTLLPARRARAERAPGGAGAAARARAPAAAAAARRLHSDGAVKRGCAVCAALASRGTSGRCGLAAAAAAATVPRCPAAMEMPLPPDGEPGPGGREGEVEGENGDGGV